jgi:hypothetical protein
MKQEEQKQNSLSVREKRILSLIREERRWSKEKFPLFYGLLATFGAVAVFSGFSKLIEGHGLLSENPIILIIVGVVVLLASGAAYKKLG